MPSMSVQPTITPSPIAYNLDLEFSGSTLDSRLVPLLGPGDPGDRPDTDMLGDLSQVSVANGMATITCHRQVTPSGRAFASAAMCTYGTFAQAFGTWESRFRYDVSDGVWPSWFLLPQGQHLPYPEIDILEAYGDVASLGPNLYETVVWPDISGSIYTIKASTDGWRTIRMVWTSTRIDLYENGTLYWSVTDPTKVPQVPMYPIYIYGVGDANWRDGVDGTAPNTLRMDIDYLRVW